MQPVKPDYAGACIRNVIRAVRGGDESWVPDVVRDASGVVLLILDGLPWTTLQERGEELPTLSAMSGGPITSVVPSTTPTALLSITTALTPGEHGIIGYRVLVDGHVLNVLRWTVAGGGLAPSPADLQPRDAFDGEPVPVVTRAAFRSTGFTELQLRGAAFHGWSTTAGLIERCARLRAAGERFVYAYYDGIDVTAHVHGMRDGYFTRELTFCDALVAELLDALPDDTALVVTADHGHKHFTDRVDLSGHTPMIAHHSGESRFRYLHARPGAADDLLDATTESYSGHSWVFSRGRLVDEGWLGPRTPSRDVLQRIGDVILAAREPIGYVDPANPGEGRLRSGHGSLTPDEMLVPLIAARGNA